MECSELKSINPVADLDKWASVKNGEISTLTLVLKHVNGCPSLIAAENYFVFIEDSTLTF